MNFKQKLQSPKGLSNFQKLRNVVKKKFLLLKPGFNRNCIYIKSDDFVFDKNAYKPEILGKYLSKKEYDTIISELNKVVTKSFIQNNKHEKVKIYRFIYFLIIISLSFFIIGAVILHHAKLFHETNPDELNLYYVISILLFLSTLAIILGLTVHNFQHTSIQITTLEDTIHSYIKQYVSFLNVYFQGIFQWNYYPHKATIELCIVDIDDDENDTGKLTKLTRKNYGYLEKRKKCEDLKKIEEVFEGNCNEEDEMIKKKLFGDGWEEKNKLDYNYYENESSGEEDNKENDEEIKEEKDEDNKTLNNNYGQTTIIKNSQILNSTDDGEEVSGHNMRMINECEENVTLINRNLQLQNQNSNGFLREFIHTKSYSYS